MMHRAVRIRSFGAPEVMAWEDIPPGDPGPGQARVRHAAVGLNYLDIYQREGHYPLPLPSGLGVAGAGVVDAVGAGVDGLREGDRVAYAGVPPGSYADARLVAADRLVPLPAGIGDETAAATLQQGITARWLLKDAAAPKAGDTVLFHAAAGGVGTLFCQWAQRHGVRVIGTVGSAAKVAHAQAHGCDEVLVSGRDDIAARVAALTQGRGVQVVYDSVGQDSWDASLKSLARRGLLVSFGSASGPVPTLDVNVLGERGSLYLTRPRFVHYAAERSALLEMAADYFAQLLQGALRAPLGRRYRFDELVQAHHDMQGRRTLGSSVLLP